MFKKIIIAILFFSFWLPFASQAQENNKPKNIDETFDAQVIEVIQEKNLIREDSSESTQQDLKLKGLSGSWGGRDFIYRGISSLDVPSNNLFKIGDKVLVNWTKDQDNNDQFFIQNYIRHDYIYILAFIFCLVIILVGRAKGIRSLLSLAASFLVIIKFIIPGIMSGYSPLIISLLGSALILGIIIYITDGFSRKSHIAILSVLISLVITFVLSVLFVKLCRLTGFSSEEVTFLVGVNSSNIVDFQGLLLAGILIGALGVLDDAILGQIEAVRQINKANPNLSRKQVIKSANEIGTTHLGAMVNTLFLTYAGASLPLLLLFSLGSDYSIGWARAIDNEFIATEIVRTLAGSIGLALAFPITTVLAAYFLTAKNK